MPSETPKTRYAKSGDVNIAYQVVGDGPLDLVLCPAGSPTSSYDWEEPGYARFLAPARSFSRLILFDKRGTGLSDRAGRPRLTSRSGWTTCGPSWMPPERERAALFGYSEGGPMCCALRRDLSRSGRRPSCSYGTYAKRRIRTTTTRGAATEEERRAYADEPSSASGRSTVRPRAATRRTQTRPDARWWRGVLVLPREPRRRLGDLIADEQPDRRASRPPERSASRRSCSTASATAIVPRRGGPLHRRAHPGRAVRRARRRGITCPRSTRTRSLDEIEEFLTGVRRGTGARPCARDRAVHGHRGLDASASPSSATAAGESCSSSTTPRFGASSSAVADVRWTRLATASSRPSTARRARSAARAPIRDAVRELGLEHPRRAAHGRVRAGRRARSPASPSTPARGLRRAAGAGRSARLEHGEGPRRRLGHRVRGARRARAEGRSGHMAAVRCRRCLTPTSSTPFAARSAGRTGRLRASAPTSSRGRC